MSKLNRSLEDLTVDFVYLDVLRQSGAVNMFGAGPYLMAARNMDRGIAKAVLLSWMSTFGSGESEAAVRAGKELQEGE